MYSHRRLMTYIVAMRHNIRSIFSDTYVLAILNNV